MRTLGGPWPPYHLPHHCSDSSYCSKSLRLSLHPRPTSCVVSMCGGSGGILHASFGDFPFLKKWSNSFHKHFSQNPILSPLRVRQPLQKALTVVITALGNGTLLLLLRIFQKPHPGWLHPGVDVATSRLWSQRGVARLGHSTGLQGEPDARHRPRDGRKNQWW